MILDKKQNFFGILLLHFILLCTQDSFSQLQDNAFRNVANKMYWQNRKPFEGYWQQDVAYKIKASINEKTNVIEATEELQYWNNSPDALSFVYFHLYQNAFTKGSYLEELHKVNKQPIRRMGKYQQQGLGTLVENLTVNGKKCKVEIDNTIMKVTLPEPLQPGATVVFKMNFATFFDSGDFRRRMAVSSAWGFKRFNGVHWYPRISVYDIKKGWDTDQHLNKELYGDYGLFDVELNFAENYVVEATGALQNPAEVYPGDLRQRLDISNFAKKPWNEAPSIITPYDSSRRKTWHYIANNVHDFAFTADPTYRIGETSCTPSGLNEKPIQCICVVQEPHASRWQTAPDYVAKIIKTFSEDFGMYEYPKMVAADAGDGMEYPMLTLDGGAEPDFHGLFVHEIGHNWFYGMIGNNETYRAALDEGFTQFLTAWGLRRIDGDTMIESPEKNKYKRNHRDAKLTLDRNVYNRYMNDAVRCDDKALNTHSNDFHSAIGHENGYSNVYHKTATMLFNLQYVLGDDLFLRAMKHYVAKWKMAHPYFEDFRQSIIEYTHQDLNWFFDQWLETTKNIDYSIVSIKKSLIRDEYKIKFKRKGQMQMPIDFQVRGKDGKTYDYHIPNNYFIKQTDAKVLNKWYGWDLLYPTYTAKVNIPGGLKSVQIDPSYRLADVDMMNNYKRPFMHAAPESRRLQWESFVYNPPSWKKYNAYIRPDIWWNAVDGFKVGINVNGNYLNYLRKLNCTVWFNTHAANLYTYRPYEGQSAFDTYSPIDYTLRYENAMKFISPKINWGVDSRYIDGFARHNIYSQYKINDHHQFKIEATSLFRKRTNNRAYLFYPDEWSSVVSSAVEGSKENSFLQLSWSSQFQYNRGNGRSVITLRAPLSYNYSYLQGELIQNTYWKKLDLRSRLFVRLGMGDDIPYESALFMQGANPEEMMESKYARSHGVVPLEAGGFSTNDFAYFHQGGGLNLRGYNGYYAIDEDQNGVQYINYKSRSGAALNLEIDFDRLVKIAPRYIRDYLHFDTYLFGDAGIVSRGLLNTTNIPELTPVRQWSKVRMDAGVGVAMTIKKFGPFEKLSPMTIRFDMPLFLSSPPFAQPDFIAWRWVLGINRAF
ncbi:MAG: M1 family metallopeptidase [Chitinophagaceae bacterium]|nr:M1 family metallopeptidase [Chitinophagaceae bacterium]